MENIIVFSLSSSEELADQICEHLQIRRGKIKVDHFADGEILVEPDISVRGKNVYLVQSTSYPVSENYMEVLIALDAFKRASAKEVTVVSPYFGYARQDRKARARQPITAKLMADLLQAAGADRVVTLDLHAPQIQGFFDIPIDDLTATTLFGQYYRQKHFDEDVVIVSPDHGGATRAPSWMILSILVDPYWVVFKCFTIKEQKRFIVPVHMEFCPEMRVKKLKILQLKN